MSILYVNAALEAEPRARLEAALVGREVVWGAPTDVLTAGAVDEALRRAAIVFGQPPPDALLDAPALRFVQLTSAGWARYDRPDLRAALRRGGAVLCNASSVYAEPVADHALAALLALSRRLPEALAEQHGARRWPQAALRGGSQRLRGQRALLLGYGAIARAMVPRLRAFGLEVVGHRRRRRGDEEVPIVGPEDLPAALADADHVFDLLPEGEATHGFVDAAFLARMKRGARLYNLGRGATVDQDALRAALAGGRLDAAWLDVTTPEPLPPDHPLWQTPRLYVSPHTAGGHADESARHVELFLGNLAAFAAGGLLVDRVL